MACSICQPTVLCGLDAINKNINLMKTLENTQGCKMKRVCGIPKCSHHTQLLQVLNISSVNDMLMQSITSLHTWFFKVNSLLPDLCVYDSAVLCPVVKLFQVK